MKGKYTVMRKWSAHGWIHFDFWNYDREIGIDLSLPKSQFGFAKEINCGDEFSGVRMILIMFKILFKRRKRK